MRKLEWEKEFVVYHIKSKGFHKAFNIKSGAKRSTSCANRNTGRLTYAYAPWNTYWKTINYVKLDN